MIISKLTPFLCALAIGATGFTVRAEDNPAQAAARMALAKQLFEISGQPAASAADTNAVTKPLTGKEARAKAKADKAAADAKAKQDAADLKAKQEADKQLADQSAAQAKSAAAQADAQANANQAAANVAAPGDSAQKEAAERAALAAALADRTNTSMQATTSATVPPVATDATAKKEKKKKQDAAAAVPPAAVPPGAPATTNYIGQELGMKQLAAPALPISATKVERLQALLAKYKADQLTPEEYHQQRAAILAEP